MKNIAKTLLLTLLLALSVMLVMASCSDDEENGDSSSEISIAIKSDAMPQLQYVLGEELNLSGGILVVTENGSASEVSLTAEGVSVSGYDKGKLGEQTITVSYKEKTVQFTVTVVDRMQVIDYIADYLVGDAFNSSKGRLKITRNDGSTYTVPLSNQSVTVTGFDSSAAANGLTLTATYTSGTDSFTKTFTVNVYAVESVELHKPNKVAYNSHEGGLDVSGGYLTLKGNGGKLTKDVTITSDMVSGFDLTAVNKTNTPKTQTLTVTYDNKTYNYDVKLVYTDISYFNASVSSFASLIWTGEKLPTITDEDGNLALSLMEIYLDMSKAEKSYVSTSDALSVARAAMAYGYVKWSEEIAKYSDVIGFSESGTLELYCKSYETVKAALSNTGLKNASSPLYTVAPIIIDLADEFKKETLITDLTFADCAVADAQTVSTKVSELEYMVALHEKFALIDADWADKDIMTYETKVKEIYTFITESLYNDSSASILYAHVSSWRDANDAFDILYAYYFAKNDMDSITTLASLRLPGELQELFDACAGAFNQILQVSSYNVFDTSGFFYYYFKAVKLSEQLQSNENAIIRELYDTLPLNGLLGMTDSTVQYTFDTLVEYFRTANAGSLQYYSSALLGVEAYNRLISKYVDMLTKLLDQKGYEDTAEYGEAIEELFNMYVALSPTEQLNFLSTLNAYYNMGYPPLAFDDTGDYAYITCMFTQLLNQYFRDKLPTEAAVGAYDNLVLAMEIYAQRTSYKDWLKEFKSRMDSVISTYNAMSNADKAIFNGYLSEAYDKYSAIRARYTDGATSTELGDWASAFEALEEAIVNIDNAYYLLEQGYPVYSLLFSAFERASVIVDNILTNAPEEIKNAYYYEDLYVISAEVTGDVALYYSYEYMFNFYRSIYIDCMCGFFGGSTNYYDVYNEIKLGDFLDATYELIWTFAWNNVFGNENNPWDRENVISVMEEFRKLDREAQVIFRLIEGDFGLYYEALQQFVTDEIAADAENTAVVLYKMLELEKLMLSADPEDADAVAGLRTSLEALKTAYEALEGNDKTAFGDFDNIYSDLVNDCQAMLDALEA